MKKIFPWSILLVLLSFNSSFSGATGSNASIAVPEAKKIQNQQSVAKYPLDPTKVEHINYATQRIESGEKISNIKRGLGNIKVQWRLRLRSVPTDINIEQYNNDWRGKIYFGSNEGNFSGRLWAVTPASDPEKVTALTYPTLQPVLYPPVKEGNYFIFITNDFVHDTPSVYYVHEFFTEGGLVIFKPFDSRGMRFRTRLGPPVSGEDGRVYFGSFQEQSRLAPTPYLSVRFKLCWVDARGNSDVLNDLDYIMLDVVFNKSPQNSPFHDLVLNPINSVLVIPPNTATSVEHRVFAASFHWQWHDLGSHYQYHTCGSDTDISLFLLKNYNVNLSRAWPMCAPYVDLSYPISAPVIRQDLNHHVTTYFADVHSIVRAVLENGELYFQTNLGGDLSSSQASLDDKHIYFPSSNGYIYMLNFQGFVEKELACLVDGKLHPAGKKVAVKGHHLYAVTSDGYFLVFDLNMPNGHELVASSFYNAVTAPAVSKDGTIFLGSGDGYLYSLVFSKTRQF